jgi:hypothetical protein
MDANIVMNTKLIKIIQLYYFSQESKTIIPIFQGAYLARNSGDHIQCQNSNI